jgi:hypothetical protein
MASFTTQLSSKTTFILYNVKMEEFGGLQHTDNHVIEFSLAALIASSLSQDPVTVFLSLASRADMQT